MKVISFKDECRKLKANKYEKETMLKAEKIGLEKLNFYNNIKNIQERQEELDRLCAKNALLREQIKVLRFKESVAAYKLDKRWKQDRKSPDSYCMWSIATYKLGKMVEKIEDSETESMGISWFTYLRAIQEGLIKDKRVELEGIKGSERWRSITQSN